MSDRSAGYVTDVGYTFGYHAGLNPLALRLAFLRAGLEPPAIHTACELGFGQGVSLAVHAAAGPARWWGTDLLPEHVAFARSLDAASGAGATLAEATFEEFDARRDLPAFDFIGLHGVLSWISAGNRARIASFVRDRLAPGGVVYTGYNALPGWADMVPLREVMTEHARRAGAGGTVERIEAALEFTARLLDANPLAARASPRVAERFEHLRHADRRYLAHEYFNRDWHPLYFAEVAGLFASAGLRHACPARLRDQLDELNYTGEQRRLLAGIDDAQLRETVRDFLATPQVRRDYWVRAPRPLAGGALLDAWRGTRVVLAVARDEVAERVTGPLGEQRLSGAAHHAVLDALGDHRPRTLGDVQAASAGLGMDEVIAAACELAAFDYVVSAQDEATTGRCASRAGALNAHLIARAAATDDIAVLASPVTGGGVPVGRLEQLFCGALASGQASPEEWAASAAGSRRAGADTVGWDGSDLLRQARRFAARRLPLLRALRVVAG